MGLIADLKTNEYTSNVLPIWNVFVRFIIFTLVGLLIFRQKQEYKKLIQLNDELQHANKEKNRLLGITSHDLRNPIGTIYSYSDLLITDYRDKLLIN